MPADAPKIAMAAMVEAGAWGASDAGPIVRKTLTAWIETQGGTVPPMTPEVAPQVPADNDQPEDAPVATPADMPAAPSSTTDDNDGDAQ
jgi:penicillin-binding protein 2